MNIFKGKIKCLKCGKNHKFKKERGKHIYICSGYANYGKDFCSRNVVEEQDIIDTVERHILINNVRLESDIYSYIQKIEVGGEGEYTVCYESGERSIISPYRIKF